MQTKAKTAPKPVNAAPIAAPATAATVLCAFGLADAQRAILAAHNAKNPASPPFKFAKTYGAINLATSKAFKRDTKSFTPRLTIALTGIIAAMPDSPFQARILDAGQSAILINSGFLSYVSGGITAGSLIRDAKADFAMLALTDSGRKAYAATNL